MARRLSRREFHNIRRTNEDRVPQQNRVFRTGRTAGVHIGPDSALTVSAVWACIRYLTYTVAMLPWDVKSDSSKGTEIQKRHPVARLIGKRVSDDYTSFQFREMMLNWSLRHGNGYAEIERDIMGRPLALHPIHPVRVAVFRDLETQKVYYEVGNNYGGTVRIEAADMFHLRGFGESVVGVNVMAYAADSIGWTKAAQLFGAAFFGNGSVMSGIVKSKRRLSEAGMKGIRMEFEEFHKGAQKSNRVAVLDNELEYTPLGIEPEKGQFIQTNQHLIEEICRWFGVPPHKIYHLLRATFSNIEHQSIEVVTDSIMPWVRRFEDEADFKLFGNRSSVYTKMDLRELLRGDTDARIKRWRGLREIGAMNVNEIRAEDGQNGIGPDGDKYVMQGQYTTLEKIGEEPEQQPQAPTSAPKENDDDSQEPEAEALPEDLAERFRAYHHQQGTRAPARTAETIEA